MNHLQHSMAIELDANPSQPRIEYWTRKIEAVVNAALAAAPQTQEPPREREARKIIVRNDNESLTAEQREDIYNGKLPKEKR